MMLYLMMWVSAHRGWITGAFALSFWVAAYYWYLKTDIRNYFHVRRPHSWSVDMVTKKTQGGKRPLQ